ncbi:MAG: response regulator transcription factor [Deltaproteobacteria bacterium]|jgi:DNA-binding CsgD family transcriptional regulator|nr:response regulator transcription factor [Deltaproteobacteria bacterium]
MLDDLNVSKLRNLTQFILNSRNCISEFDLSALIKDLKQIVHFSHWFIAIFETTALNQENDFLCFGNFSKRWIFEHQYQKIKPNQATLIFSNQDLKNWIEGKKNFNFKLYRELFLNHQYNSVGDYFYLHEFQKNLIEKYVFSFFNLEPISNQDQLIFETITPFLSETISKIRKNNQKNVLTSRQVEILEMVQFGFNRKQIANEIKLTEANVKYHLKQIFRKLKVFNQASAVRKALSYRLIEY